MNNSQRLYTCCVIFIHPYQIACTTIAMMLHYLYLTVFGWMSVEGINLYYKLVKVYGSEKNRMKLYMCIGWILPAPIVIITAGIRFKSYTLDTRWDMSTGRKKYFIISVRPFVKQAHNEIELSSASEYNTFPFRVAYLRVHMKRRTREYAWDSFML